MSRRSVSIPSALLALFLAATSAAAREERWVQVGPNGGVLHGLAAAPSAPGTVYLGSQRGLFRSTDGGASWRPVGSREPLMVMAVDRDDAKVLYAMRTEGLSRSDDGGLSWATMDQGLAGTSGAPYVFKLVLDPADANLLYAVTSGGIFVSRDGGRSWVAYSLEGEYVQSLEIGPGGTEWFAAAYLDDGLRTEVLASTDRGRTWTPTGWSGSNGLPGELFLADAQSLYALVQGAVFRRLGGGPWTRLNTLPQGLDVYDLAASAGRLYAATLYGVYRSIDRGASWLPQAGARDLGNARPRDTVYQLVVLPGAPQSLLAAGEAGLWRSDQGGAGWRASSRGLVFHYIDALAISADSAVYASVGLQGIYRSDDRGATWKQRNRGLALSQGRSQVEIPALATSPAKPEGLYAAICRFGGCGIARSNDRGLSWRESPLPVSAQVTSITVDPSSFETVYVVAVQHVADEPVWVVLGSLDGGVTWNRLLADPSGISQLAVDPQDPSTLYAWTFSGLLKSGDGGSRWSKVGRGLSIIPSTEARTVAIDPHNPRRLYVGTFEGVYRSNDGGATFRPFRKGLPRFTYGQRLVIDPQDPSKLYYVLDQKGVFRWNRRTRTWEELGTGLPKEEAYVGELEIDPVHPDVLYAGTEDGGVFRIQLEEP